MRQPSPPSGQSRHSPSKRRNGPRSSRIDIACGRRFGLRVRKSKRTPLCATTMSATTTSSLRSTIVALAHQGMKAG